MKTGIILLAAGGCLLLTALARAAAPVNDNFASSFTLSSQLLTNTVNASNQNADKEPNEPPHAGNAGGSSVWWTWTAPVTATVTLDTVGSPFDTLLAVYTGNSVSTLTSVASDDDSGGNKTSLLTFSAAAGTAYRIAVDGWGGASGSFVLHLLVAAAPPQITAQPQSQAVVPGTGVGFSVSAIGTTPLSYRWRRNGSPISGATGPNYGLVQAQTTDAGTYTVVVTNVVGSITSSPAVLTVQLLPPNDNLANALLVSGISNTWLGNNLSATREPGEPNPTGYAGGRSVWWSWTAPITGAMALTTFGTAFDTVLAVYTGSIVSNLNLVASGRSVGGTGNTRMTFNAIAGTTYRIAVDGYAGSGGDVVLNLLPPPPNDNFFNRAEISGTQATVSGYNFNATAEPGEPAHPGRLGAGSVWWRWVAPSNGKFVIHAFDGSDVVPLAVYTGSSVSNLTVVGSADYSREPAVLLNAVAGVEYEIAVAARSDPGENYVLTLRPAPPNDAFANRITLTGQTLTVTGYNFGATLETGEPAPPQLDGGKSVWWSWTAPANLAASIDTQGSSFAPRVAVYAGSSITNLTLVTSYYGAIRFAASSGTTYQIAVYGPDYYPESGNIVLKLSAVPPPSNDAFANRVQLSGTTSTANANNTDATRESGEPNHGDYAPVDKSVWWKWTAPTNGTVTLDSTGSSSTPLLAVYTGDSVSSLALVTTVGDGFGNGPSRAIFYGVAGTEYEIAAAGFSGGAITFQLHQLPTRLNDAFADRIHIVALTNTLAGHNGRATKESGEPNHAGNAGGRSVWWTWTAPANASVTVGTIGSTFDTLLAVYTGNSVSNLGLVATNDDRGEDRTSELKFSARADASYQIAVDGWNADSGHILLNLQAAPSLANDAFADRIALVGSSNTVSANIAGATVEPGEPVSSRSLWWSWTAPAFGEVSVQITGGGGFGVSVFTGDSLTNLAYVYSVSGFPSFAFPGSAGSTYQIAVTGSESSGAFTLTVRQARPPTPFQITSQPQNAVGSVGYSSTFSVGVAGVGPLFFQWRKDGVEIPRATNISYIISNFQMSDVGTYSVVVWDSVNTLVSSNAALTAALDRIPPGNDVFANRFTIPGLTATVTGSNVFATKEPGEPDHASNPGGHSVWWTWIAPTNWAVDLDTIGSSFDTLLAVYTGGVVSNLTLVKSDDQSGGGDRSRLTFTAVAGTAYQIAVDGRYGFQGDIVMNLRSAAPPSNDTFENRSLLTGLTSSAVGDNRGATQEPDESGHAGSAGGKSVWWTWTAPTNGTVTLDTIGSSFDTLLAVYTGASLPALAPVAGDDEGGTNHSSRLSFFALAGTDYQIAVDGFAADSGSVVLNLRQTPSTFGQVDVAFKGNWPGFRNGRAYDIAVVGTVAYVAIGEGGLLILDVSDPAHPRRIGSLDTPGDAQNLAVSEGFVFLAVGQPGIYILDARNPGLVSVVGAYSAFTNVNRIAVRGGYAYVADRKAGLQILEVTDKANPVLVASIPGQARTVVLDGNYAYVCEGTNGLRIVNISSPSNPVTTSVYRMDILFGSGLFAGSVAVTNGYAYLVNLWSLDVIAVTNAFNPIRINALFLGSPQYYRPVGELALDGNTLFVAYGPTELLGSVGRFDITDLTNPQPVDPRFGNFALNDLLGATVANGCVFAANGSQGIAIFEAAQRATDPLSFFYTAPNSFDLAIQGNYAYLANGVSGLQIVNIEAPSSPALAGSSTGAVYTVGTLGSYALAGTLAPAPQYIGRLAILDVGNPTVPRYVKAIEGPLTRRIVTSDNRAYGLSGGIALGIYVPQDYYYLHSETYSFDTYDLSAPENPVLLDSERDYPSEVLSGRARALAVKGNYAFVASSSGLSILDLTDHSKVFTQPTIGNVRAVAVAANRLAVAEEDGLEVFDVSSPTKPAWRGRLGIAAGPAYGFSDVAVAGNHILVVNTNTGLHVIDARTTNLVEVGRYAASGCERVALAGNYALVTQGPQGLTIFDLGPSFASAPAISSQPSHRRALPSANVRFDVGANGTVPMSYQWRRGGTNLPGATNSTLTLPNVQADQAGVYSVVVSNSAGVAFSSEAILSVDIPPVVALLSPTDSQVFLAPATVLLEAEASDPDTNGTVAQVEFYQDSTLLGLVAARPFRRTVTLPSSGSYVFTARATDNEGASTLSTPVRVIVTNTQMFQLGSRSYSSYESTNQSVYDPTGHVTVAIRRNSGGTAASVSYFTTDGSARAVTSAGVGQYYAATGQVNFGIGEWIKEVSVQLVNDDVYRGDRFFRVQLAAPSANWGLADPSEAIITILENDAPSSTNSWTDVALPAGAPGGRGSLRVVLQPPDAQGRWRFPWETAWRASGSTATNLAPDNYPVEFLPRSNFLAPEMETNVVTAGSSESVTNYYEGSSPPVGSLAFTLRPSSVANAGEAAQRGQWRLQEDPSRWHDTGVTLSDLPAGLRVVEFKYVEGFETPAPRIVRVVAGQPTLYEATYRISQPAPGEEPTVLPSFSTLTNGVRSGLPYAFNGQILSEAGWASGFVVRRRTVLTAAHAVFDSEQLTYANNVWWFFQKHAPEYEPVPLQARGWYVFEGYAARRAEDVASPAYQPGESSAESQNLDVAAVYFFADAGRGGSGGYLTTDEARNWLTSPLLKMLIGYPTEGVPEDRRGRMHKSGPGAYYFEPGANQIYRTFDLKGYPGGSGGPLCVEATNSLGQRFYLPAAVYLGGSGETVVRAIDLDVVDLINRAENSGNGGGNNTGGGVIRIVSGLGISSTRPGLVAVTLGPRAAVRLGGRWRVSPTNYGSLSAYTNYMDVSRTLAVRTNDFTIEMAELPGFRRPTNQTLEIVGGATVPLNLLYSVEPPRLFLARTHGLGLTGTVDTAYRIEGAPWLPIQSNGLSWETGLLHAGTNWVPGTSSTGASSRFYRAVWLSE